MTEENKALFLFDDVEVDALTFNVKKAGSSVQVEPKAFMVLLFLIRNRGRLVEKEEILDSVWKETSVTENALTREIAKLRRLLGDDPKQARYIQTVHTRGYRFVAEVEVRNGGAKNGHENGTGRAEVIPANGGGQTVNGNGNGNGAAVMSTTLTAPHSADAERVVAAAPPPNGAGERGAAPARRPLLSRKTLLTACVVFVGLVAFLLLAWNFYRESDRPAPPAVLEIVPFTTAPGLDLNPTFSPDGHSLAYSSDRGGSTEIYAKPLAPGGREVQLTSDGNQNMEPAWSPGGDFIVYHSAKRGGIWLIPALGGVPRQLTEFGCHPSWSRDGSSVAFQSEPFHDMLQPYASSATIWVVPAQGGTPRQITQPGSPPGGHLFPTWSPSGKHLAFLNANIESMQIWSVSVAGGELKQVSPDGTGDKADVVYSPDGASIFFTMGMTLYMVRVSPETGERISRASKVADLGSTLFRHPTFSADGSKIAYSAWTVKSNVWSVPISPDTHEAAGPPVALTNETNSRNGLTAFSPDGRRIAFTSMRRGSNYQLWLMDSDGGNPSQLTTDADAAYGPSWSPEGDRITFESVRGGRTTLSQMELESRRESVLAEANRLEVLRLSPDARRVAFTYAPGNFFNVGVMSAGGGEPRQLTFEKTFTGLPSWSPDGRLLAFQSRRGDDMQIMLVPSDGGGDAAPVQLTFGRGDKWPYSWSPDGERVAFAGSREGVWNVWWVSRSDGTQMQLTDNNSPRVLIRFPDWSPLGNQIVYEQAEITGNIHVMSLKAN